RLEDVWALGALGGRDDFPRLVEVVTSYDPARRSSPAVRALFEIRRKLGELFGWDESDTGVGARVPSLLDRLPPDLRDAAPLPQSGAFPFTPLYLTGNEWAAELANRTVHGVLHLGWVADGRGGYRGQLAILVKPNGLLGTAYLAAIKPFRHLLVYPAMLRELEQEWRGVTGA
ncbi:MAG: hypothetical protein QOJ03_1468, partial [Frankiaceae bacterium]|nr:hypothetical protein [Frankiaceae bacterium]